MTKSTPLDTVTRNLNQLSDDDLRLVRRLIDGILEAREHEQARNTSGLAVEERDKTPDSKQRSPAATSKSTCKHGERGYFEEKIINGCGPYLYLRYWDGKIHRSVYLGKASNDSQDDEL